MRYMHGAVWNEGIKITANRIVFNNYQFLSQLTIGGTCMVMR